MNDSEGQIERSERQEPSAQTLTPAAEAGTEAGPKQETAVALPLWGVGSPKKRLLAFGMVVAYAVIFYLLIRVVGLLLIGARNLPAPTRNVLSEVLLALCAIGAAVIAAKLERRKFSSYGFGDRLAVRRFLSASFWGFAALTVFLLGLRVTHHYYFGSPGIHGAEIVRFALTYLVLFLAVAVFEESLTRGYALFKLSEAIGFWPAVILLSILFGYGHLNNKGESTFGVVAAGLFGVVIAYSIFRTGSLWWAIGFHFMWDYSESFIYGVPDSGFVAPGHLLNPSFNGPAWITGGTVGPEGSYFILLVLAGLALVIHVTLPRRETI
jgi:uncharacterized protein